MYEGFTSNNENNFTTIGHPRNKITWKSDHIRRCRTMGSPQAMLAEFNPRPYIVSVKRGSLLV